MNKQMLAGPLFLALAACSGGANDATKSEATEVEATSDAGDGEATQVASGEGDAKVPGTDYHATAPVKCGFGNAAPTQDCEAGVKRNWGEDGTTLVEVAKPDGRKRALFFKGTEPYGADSAEADGSAGWDFRTTREGDRVTIKYGPETYVIVDALITGG